MSNDGALEEGELIFDGVVDLEEFAKEGKRPPRARSYRLRINDDQFEWEKPFITGREVRHWRD